MVIEYISVIYLEINYVFIYKNKIFSRMRIKLCDKFQEEREKVCSDLISLLGLDDQNTFLLCELDTDIEKQEKIMAMKEEIQKVFACSTISSFKPNFSCKRPYLNIIRSILRKQGYQFIGTDIELRLETNVYKRTMRYKICRE